MNEMISPLDNSTAKLNPQNSFLMDMRKYFASTPVQVQDEGEEETPSVEDPRRIISIDEVVSGIEDMSEDDAHWTSHPLRIIYLVSTFLQKIKTSTHLYRFKLLDKNIFKVIGDFASDFYFYQRRNMLKKKNSCLNNTLLFPLQCIPKFEIRVLQPDHIVRALLDFMLLLCSIMILIYIPIKLAFTSNTSFQFNDLFDLITLSMLILEIIIKLNTAFYKDGVIHTRRKQILLNYLQTDFVSDIGYIFAYLMTQIGESRLELILMLRIFKVQAYVEKLEDLTFIREKFAAPIDLVKLICFLFYINHICACIWNYIGEIQLNKNDTNWIQRYDVVDAPFQVRYLTSFYWCTMTTLTVGYGDIVPGNDLERLVTCLYVIFCSIAFGYTISAIGEIFKSMAEKKEKYKNSMAQITSYLKYKNFNKHLQMKVIRYFEYLFTQQMHKNEETEGWMEQLSADLIEEVKKATYLPILLKNRLFKEQFSKELLDDISQQMITKQYKNGDTVIQQDQSVSNLVFIIKGSLSVTASQKYLRSYKPGYVVGLKNFLTQQTVQCTFKAETSCEIALLSYESFIACLNKNDKDLQTFQMIKDSLTFNTNNKKLAEVCMICKSNHNFIHCPFTFYQFNNNTVYKKNRQVQIRSYFGRRPLKMMSFKQVRKEYQFYALSLALEQGYLREDEIDVNYENKLGLEVSKVNQVLNSPPSQKNFGSRLNSFRFDLVQQFVKLDSGPRKQSGSISKNQSQKLLEPEVSKHSNQSSSKDMVPRPPNLKQSSFSKKTSIKKQYSIVRPTAPSYEIPSKIEIIQLDSVAEIPTNQLEQIQIEYQAYLSKFSDYILDKYKCFQYYNVDFNISNILEKINHKQSIRLPSTRRIDFYKQQFISQRNQYLKSNLPVNRSQGLLS